MRIGLLTFHHAHNCGAALQVFALQTVLQHLGHDVTVINYRVARIDRSYETCSDLRKQRFEQFLQDKLQLSPLYHSLRELQNAEHPYDILIAGSDQIWNESILGGLNSAYFCNFGTSSMRRIIYGASLGANSLSRNNRFLFPLFLQYPDFISVREPSMVPLLQPYTQKPIEVVSDPTLLLDTDFYQALLPKLPAPAPYIYLHYVHHSGENPELDATARRLSSLTGLPILKNRSGKRFEKELPDCRDDGPTEFLARIRTADYVITDSFHATVFSVLFHKHFLTVPPVKRPERLHELLHALRLTSHQYCPGFSLKAFLTLSDYSYQIRPSLNSLKQRSLDFLTHALTATPGQSDANYHTDQNRFRCYGCGACAERFPETVNGLSPDSEGFLYPKRIDFSDKNRISCIFFHSFPSFFPCTASLAKEEQQSASYLAYHKNLYERMLSYEGGVLPEFFRQILQNGGAVIGRAYDSSTHTIRYQLAYTDKDCTPFLSARPQEANPLELYRLIRKFASSASAPLLILAPPCHLFAVRTLFSETDYNLILLEEKCDGICSSLPVLRYITQIEKHAQKPVRDYNLASKHFTKSGLRIEFTHSDNSLSCEYRSDSAFLKDYQQHMIQRPVCYRCQLHCSFPCIGDLAFTSISEKQSVNFAPPDKLLTYLVPRTDAGQKLFNSCKDKLYVKQLTQEEKKALFSRESLQPFPLTISRPRYYQQLLQE